MLFGDSSRAAAHKRVNFLDVEKTAIKDRRGKKKARSGRWKKLIIIVVSEVTSIYLEAYILVLRWVQSSGKSGGPCLATFFFFFL